MQANDTILSWPLQSWQRFALALISSVLVIFSIPQYNIALFAWFAFTPLFFAIENTTPKRAFFIGWLAGIVTNAVSFYWIPHLLIRFGHLNIVLSYFLLLLLAFYQGLSYALFSWLIVKARSRIKKRLPLILLAPIAFVSVEFLMPILFDWYFAVTQAWHPTWIQIADITGPTGVSAMLILASAGIYDFVFEFKFHRENFIRKLKWLSIAPTLILVIFIYGQIRIHQIEAIRNRSKKIRVGVVQANIGIQQKGRAGLALQNHRLHLEESWKLQQEGIDLLVWPESSYPWAITRDRKKDYPARDPRQIMQGIKVPLIFGALTYSTEEPYPYNTALMVSPSGKFIGRFDKNYLLAFGEYIPFYDLVPSFKKWFPAASHFAHGKDVVTFPFKDKKIAPLICYEGLLPTFTRRIAKLKPNLMVNITNDAWFGKTSEPYQHMALVIFRAVELRLDFVRSVNTGVTSFIDATGKILGETKSHDPVIEKGVKPESLRGKVALMPSGHTFYTFFGDLFAYLNLFAMFMIFFGAKWLNKKQRTKTSKGHKKK